jgi:hypothetical protein
MRILDSGFNYRTYFSHTLNIRDVFQVVSLRYGRLVYNFKVHCLC